MMRRLTWHYQVFCLLLLFLYVRFQVDCITSDLDPGTHFNSSSSNSTVLCHPEQSFALLQFKNTTSTSFRQPTPKISVSPFWMPILPTGDCNPWTDSWMEGRDCCSWDGITCDKVTGNVIGVNLEHSCLEGTINESSSLFLLSHLQWIILSENGLTGFIPESLSKLEQLNYIDLSHNQLSGQIPETFGNFSELTALYLSHNNFSGSIAHDLCELLNLNSLDLSDNFLNGIVPSCLFTLPSLVSLRLSNNQLTGPIGQFDLPSSVLNEVDLGNNKINGSIPNSIFELQNLRLLDLSSNNLSGIVKFEILSKLKLLENLALSGNSLLSFTSDSNVNDTSSINLSYLTFSSCNITEFPSFLSTLKKLTWLDLSKNRIHGKISKNGSEEWKSLISLNLAHNFLTYIEHYPWKNIQYLDLRNNTLQGPLLVPPSTTRFFFVSDNKFTGQIPPAICNLSSLYVLELSDNNLGGKIPKCVGNCSTGLSMLHLRNNNFQGNIPDAFETAKRFRSLDFSGNKFKGKLPRSLSMCNLLEVINVGNNRISDTFPYWLGALPKLKVLVLRSNRFYGAISESKTIFPFSNLRIIDLSRNEFTGFLPRTFFEKLEAMMNVSKIESQRYLGGRDYQDSVTVTMKGRDIEIDVILTILTVIDLSNNHFYGGIPEVLGRLKSLIVLNLAHNSLTGNIPLQLSNLTALESLDLSSNEFDGRIPVQLESLTFLQALNLSHNKLSGLIPQGGQLSTFESDSFIGNIGLCGKPLSVLCGKPSSAKRFPPSVSYDEDDGANGFDWKITMMGYGCGLVIGLSMGYIVFSTGKPWWFVRMVEVQWQKVARKCRQTWEAEKISTVKQVPLR